MRKHIITLLATSISCTMAFAQWGGGFDFGGGGGASSGSLSSYTNKQNIDYVGDNHVGHKLDIYYPNDGKATHNVIIHIYGSAWGSNDSKGSADHGTVGKAALEAGYIFVTPNHRTYNDALWPAQINDIKAVVRYLRGNKEELKIDDSFIGISGFSSGGHLASMMGVTNGETVVKVGGESIDIEGKLGKYTSESSRVDAVCDWSGPVDCRDKSCGNPINMSPENDMVGGCGPQQCPDKHATLGTNTYIDANDVPHMICHGTTDNIVPSCEGEKYANNLKKAGIYVEWYNPGHGHQVNGDYTDEMIKFFNKIRSEKAEQGGGEEQGGGQQGGGEEQGGGQQGGGEEQGGGQQGGGSANDCVDPCSYTTKYSGGTSVSSNGVKDVGNGYNLEMWRDGNSGGMTVFGGKADCAFKANWNNSGDYLARVGYYDGSAKKKYTDLGEIYAVYNYTKSGNGGGSYSYIGIYGWTKNPLIEYYIVDDSFTPNGGGMFWQASNKGTYTVDGVTYTLKVGQRNNAPSIEGDGKNFQQIFAVRSSYQTCGTINVTEHFKNWERLGVKLGGIYDCKILCEVGGGSGSIEYTCASMSWKGQKSSLGDLSCSEGGSQGGGEQGGGSTIVEQKPYKSAISIPGTLEGEHYDIGGNGNAYKDSDDENEGDAKFRTDEGVDIVKGGTGMAIGYTTSSEWLEYTVKVEKTAKYDLTANASNGGGEINFDLYIDDAKVATVSGSKTDSWDTYTALEATTTKEIKAGEHILKIKFESSNNNIDYIKFVEHDDSQQGGGEQGGGQGSHGGHGGTYIPAGEYPISYDVENTGAACTDPVSLDKNKLKSCKTLPNPFEWADGSGKVTDFCDWSCRRNEIKREIEYWEIGEKPKFDKLEASYSGGTLTVTVYNGSNKLTLTSKISVPSGNGPHPIVIGMDGNTGSLSSSYFSKCIQVPFTHSQIAEYNSGFGGGGRSQNDPFYKLYPGTFNTKADYCAWSWGISRLIDGLEIVKDKINADLGHIAVTGCSYAGKMALYAGAFDERIALTIAQESGGGGINSWRVSSEIGSDVEGISNTNYDWFLNSFKSNFQSQIDKLPYDHHELIAMIAPRAFLAFGNPDYVWLGDASGIASLKAAEEVWKAMGIEDRFGYVVEGGHSHCQASSNQNKAAQAFINKFLHGDNSQNTKVRTSTANSNHSSGKFDWGNHKIVNNGCGETGLSENVVSDIDENDGYYLSQNRPNPTNGETMIDFTIADNSFVTIDLYNSLGVKVKSIVADEYSAGNYTLTFSAGNLPQGFYFYVMNANGYVDSKKMIVK